MLHPMLRALPAVLLLASCQQMDPAGQATTEYLTRLQPLLQENSLLAERVLLQAAAIYNDATKPEQVATAWSGDIVPIAEHLHHQSSFVAAPDVWAAKHNELVAIWGDRALAYRNIGEAIKLADAEQWKSARELADGVKLREEKWFDTLNEAVAPMGLVVDPYP